MSGKETCLLQSEPSSRSVYPDPDVFTTNQSGTKCTHLVPAQDTEAGRYAPPTRPEQSHGTGDTMHMFQMTEKSPAPVTRAFFGAFV